MPSTPVPPPVGPRAAAVLTLELARDAGPKAGLLLDVAGGSAVLAAALDTLRPGDTLYLVPAPGARPGVRARLDLAGPGVADRIRVVDSLAEVEPVDVAVLAEPVTGPAEAVRARLDEIGKYLRDGAVLAAAVPYGAGRTGGAAEELARQQAVHGSGTDLVLRHLPPLLVHRLRFTPAPLSTVERLEPARRPSSVPLARGMNIDVSGVAAAGIMAGVAVATRLTRRRSPLWLVPALAAVPVAAFFRDPHREPPADPDAVVAASDGRVLSVGHVSDPRFGGGEFLRVAVFLSVLDVHVNRAPVAGRVSDFFVVDGGFAPAMKAEAEHNVAAYTVLETDHGTVVVVQRTGLVARRIVQRAPAGALLARGERFGLIRFGSRTDVYLPAGAAEPVVAVGDRVAGGATVIARWV